MPTPVLARPEAVDSLALALVASSNAPLLLLEGDSTVTAASTSFCRTFQIDPLSVPGAPFLKLGGGEWDVPQLRSLLRATASGLAKIEEYEMDLNRPGRDTRRLVLNAQKLDYGKLDHVRVLLSVADVTDARIAENLKDDLLREKAILLQELQHRVANSLQIIASVLMMSATRATSDETRSHLHEAHHRVMSIAAVQKHLAPQRIGDVALRTYFEGLCESIGASMIRDHNRVSLKASADDSTASADISVSLGLIVTELVINALKHAFPGHRSGTIEVDYRSYGPEWTLRVSDDGIGMPTEPNSGRSGLGTSIVEALANQLDAKVRVAAAESGTTNLHHSHLTCPATKADAKLPPQPAKRNCCGRLRSGRNTRSFSRRPVDAACRNDD